MGCGLGVVFGFWVFWVLHDRTGLYPLRGLGGLRGFPGQCEIVWGWYNIPILGFRGGCLLG